MVTSSRLEILNTATRLATLAVLVYIALHLAGPQIPSGSPVTYRDVKSAERDPRAWPDLEARIPVVRIAGDVNVSGAVDVNRVHFPVTMHSDGQQFPVSLANGSLPVTVMNPSLPVKVTNEVDAHVTNHFLQTDVNNFPLTQRVEVTNFYDLPR